MTSRERLLLTLRGETPDCVPVAPDFSNMIPCRLTGKPFWQLYLYQDPPPWEAYIQAAKYFAIDAVMDGYFPLQFPEAPDPNRPPWETYIVERSPQRLVTRAAYRDGGRLVWADRVHVFPVADSPTYGLPFAKVGLPETPARWEPLEGVKPVDTGPAGLRRVMELMGDRGLVGVWLTNSAGIGGEADIFRYYDEPEQRQEWAAGRIRAMERRFAQIMALDLRPDFLCVGGSGSLVWQTVPMFREISFPAVKRAVELATAAGFPTHVHSCGPEKELVKIMAEETALTVIDPLEIPPMGDCNLAELKRRYGHKLTLKGNLHTTAVMLHGSVAQVEAACRQAIDDAAGLPGSGQYPGRFILSTGDQCGRDTPFANLHAMVATARNYGRYR